MTGQGGAAAKGDEVGSVGRGRDPRFEIWAAGPGRARLDPSGAATILDVDGEEVLRLVAGAGPPGSLGPVGVRVSSPVLRPDRIGLAAALALAGLGIPDLDPARFLRGWRALNRVAVARAFADGGARRTLPAATHERIWRWNQACDAYADRLATVEMVACSPARVRLVAPQHDPVTVLTAVCWSDAAPVVLPEVDLVLVVDGPDAVPRAIPQVALRPLLARYPRREAGFVFGRNGRIHDAGLAHWIVDDDLPPEDLLDALRTLGGVRALEPLTPGEVLDRDRRDRIEPESPARSRDISSVPPH